MKRKRPSWTMYIFWTCIGTLPGLYVATVGQLVWSGVVIAICGGFIAAARVSGQVNGMNVAGMFAWLMIAKLAGSWTADRLVELLDDVPPEEDDVAPRHELDDEPEHFERVLARFTAILPQSFRHFVENAMPDEEDDDASEWEWWRPQPLRFGMVDLVGTARDYLEQYYDSLNGQTRILLGEYIASVVNESANPLTELFSSQLLQPLATLQLREDLICRLSGPARHQFRVYCRAVDKGDVDG